MVAVKEGEVEEEVKEEVVIKGIKVVKERKVKSTPDMGQPDMLTNLLNSPVDAIGDLASQLIFVRSQDHVLGRTSGYQSQTNEIQASPQT